MQPVRFIARALRDGLCRQVPWWLFALVLAIPYAWFGVVLGATFWIDGFCYAGLASTLSDPAAYREFNSGYGRLALSHLQIGLPALGRLLQTLPVAWQWPVLETLQRAVSLGSLLIALGALAGGRPRVAHLLAGLLIAWNPFLQAFHNAFMTESLSGSMLLLGFGLSICMFRAPRADGWLLVSLVAVVFLATQFRSYFGALVFAMAGAAVWLGNPRRKILGTAVLAAGALGAIVFYPACRWVATGDWFLPGVGVNRLLVATYLNPDPQEAVREQIAAFPPDQREVLHPILTPGAPFGAEDAKKIALLMLESGLSESEVDAKLQTLGDTILAERPEFLAKRFRHGLASSAMIETSCLWMDGVVMYRGLQADAYRNHLRHVFGWHSWLSKEDYRAAFASFFDTPRDTYPATAPGQEWMRATQQDYVRAPGSLAARDPLGFGRVTPDVWAWGGLVSALVLLACRNIAGVLVLGAFVANFLVGFAVPVGNSRYAYGIFPLYMLAMAAMAAVCLRLPEAAGLRFSPAALFANALATLARRRRAKSS